VGINRQYASRHLQAVGVVVGRTEQGDEILAYPTATKESVEEQKARIVAMEQFETELPF
jgi:hypothetical protein